jgi:SPP1 gp7 family putative phage head morphogenesis protein
MIATRDDLRRLLRQRAGEFLQRFYRHDILVARAVRGVQFEAMAAFRRDVAEPLLRSLGAHLVGIDDRGHAVDFRHPQVAALLREAETIIERGVGSVRRLAEQRLASIGEQEARWVAQTAAALTGADVEPARPARPIGEAFLGDSSERWFRKMLEGPTGEQVRRTVVVGLQQGQTVDEITRAVRGTRTQAGILDASSRAVATLVRTAATASSAQARAESFKALGIARWRFLATLDTKTSIQCASNDGKAWPIGEGPIPPLHPNCRSVAVPDLGEPEGTRASINGQVDAATTFEEWLEGREEKEQDEVLGKGRAQLWRAGKITLADMVGRDLEPLTLGELRELDR